uniref:AMP-binding enzyme C-terminal domain-containing protein n=1 Tax=Amphiprion percula TaxID=161767 RepID=A0A3P8RMN9_AMPPE
MNIFNQCPAVAESAVIGYSHDIKGQDVEEADLSRQLNGIVSEKIAKYACPDFIQFVQRLPKTRSGKIMRRVLRKVVELDLDSLGDLSTLDDPAAKSRSNKQKPHYLKLTKKHGYQAKGWSLGKTNGAAVRETPPSLPAAKI